VTGHSVVSPKRARRINAMMLMCGHYDGSGDFAYHVGLPGKSGVGGGIFAVAPGVASIAVWSPGLNKVGNSEYSESVNSGSAQVGTAGTGSRGQLAAGELEGSNVDLSQEFSNLIIAQRGFEANSKVITTSDEVLQDLVNLKH